MKILSPLLLPCFGAPHYEPLEPLSIPTVGPEIRNGLGNGFGGGGAATGGVYHRKLRGPNAPSSLAEISQAPQGMSTSDRKIFSELLAQKSAQAQLRPDVTVLYERGLGFQIRTDGAAYVRIVSTAFRPSTAGGMKTGASATFVRDSDIIQINEEPPFIFQEPSTRLFRGDHRHAELMPPEIAKLFKQAARKSGGPDYLHYYPEFGFCLRPADNIPVTIISHHADQVIELRNQGDDQKGFFLRRKDIVQIGDDAPFIYKLPSGLTPPRSGFKERFQLIDSTMNATFLKALGDAFVDVRYWTDVTIDGMDLSVRFDDRQHLLHIKFKGSMAGSVLILGETFKHRIDRNHLTATFAYDRASEVIFQFGHDAPFYFSYAQVTREAERARERKRKEQEEQDRWYQDFYGGDAGESFRDFYEHFRNSYREYFNDTFGGNGSASNFYTDTGSSRETSWYEVLGVEETDIQSIKDLKSAFRRAAFKTHPDRNPDDPDSGEKFKKVNKAFEQILRARGWQS